MMSDHQIASSTLYKILRTQSLFTDTRGDKLGLALSCAETLPRGKYGLSCVSFHLASPPMLPYLIPGPFLLTIFRPTRHYDPAQLSKWRACR